MQLTATVRRAGLEPAFRAPLVAVALGMLVADCAIVSPLDDVRPTKPEPACRGASCEDAQVEAGQATNPITMREDAGPVTRPSNTLNGGSGGGPAEREDDAGAPTPQCIPRPGAPCDPLAPCSCPAGHECRLEDDGSSMRCVEPPAMGAAAGARCEKTSECGRGLECSEWKVCSRYCARNSDCNGQGFCVSFKNENKTPVAAADACTRTCDPFTSEPCAVGTGCSASAEAARVTTASCRGLRNNGMGSARGTSCTYIDECAPKLGCAEYGPRKCTPYCRSASDCPSDAPFCYLSNLQSAPNQIIGQCMVFPCNSASAGSPEPWTQGPVWTAAQFATCKEECGVSPACFLGSCMDGVRWDECRESVLTACAGAPGGPCRPEYVAQTCCQVDQCELEKPAFDACREQSQVCTDEVFRQCAAPPR